MGSRRNKSSKKKRIKVSSSKIQKRKSRRNKSNKLSSSEDDTSSDYSSSPLYSSSSSSEDDYSRKSRRKSRDVKRVKKKRTKRRSSSQDVSEGSPPVKKRKRSNRKSLDRGRKLKKQKKRRRYASISSSSSDTSISSRRSDSRSCSTCQYGSTSGGEDIDFQSPMIKTRKKVNEKRIPDEPSIEEGSESKVPKTRKKINEKRIPDEPSIEEGSESKGPSCSTCNYHSCSCDTTHSGKGYSGEGNHKRLRSVIIVPEKTLEKEGEEQGADMLKEEIVNKNQYCCSCRNFDNNDLEKKTKLASCSCFSSNQTLQVENMIRNDALPPNNETFGTTKVGSGIDPHRNEVLEISPNEGGESRISDKIANSDVEDLETVLRKKALENLQKFRKDLHTNLKSGAKEKKNDSDVNPLSPSKTEVAPYKSSDQENKEGLALNNEKFSRSSKIEINTPVEVNNGKESGHTKQSVLQPADRSELSVSPEKDCTGGPVLTNELEPGKLSCSTTVQTYKKENPLASKRNITKAPIPLRPGVLSTGTSDNLDMGAGNSRISPIVKTTPSVRSTSEGHTSKDQPDETKDGSQFEKKTMSVMRGGEMVQVSYKVYIPKRASALARRQLKR